jgi:hypothetical protein
MSQAAPSGPSFARGQWSTQTPRRCVRLGSVPGLPGRGAAGACPEGWPLERSRRRRAAAERDGGEEGWPCVCRPGSVGCRGDIRTWAAGSQPELLFLQGSNNSLASVGKTRPEGRASVQRASQFASSGALRRGQADPAPSRARVHLARRRISPTPMVVHKLRALGKRVQHVAVRPGSALSGEAPQVQLASATPPPTVLAAWCGGDPAACEAAGGRASASANGPGQLASRSRLPDSVAEKPCVSPATTRTWSAA